MLRQSYGERTVAILQEFGQDGLNLAEKYGDDLARIIDNLEPTEAKKTVSLINSYGDEALDLFKEGKGADEVKKIVEGGLSETSYGKSSGKLNWDAIVSKKGETRVDHINRHAVPNNSRETHGVFNGNPIDMVNDAWEQRYLVEPISDGMGGTIYNIPYKNAGYESGYINTGAQMDYITIVTLDESTDLITAFPSFGDYHK